MQTPIYLYRWRNTKRLSTRESVFHVISVILRPHGRRIWETTKRPNTAGSDIRVRSVATRLHLNDIYRSINRGNTVMRQHKLPQDTGAVRICLRDFQKLANDLIILISAIIFFASVLYLHHRSCSDRNL